jgi:hypothetical protein
MREGLVEKIIEDCCGAKLLGNVAGDREPLVEIMDMVTDMFRRKRKSLKDPQVRKAWCQVIEKLQKEDGRVLNHKTFMPCGRCDQEFEPVVTERLLKLVPTYRRTRSYEDLMAILLCPACGGPVRAKRTMTRTSSDLRSVKNDDVCESLVEEFMGSQPHSCENLPDNGPDR